MKNGQEFLKNNGASEDISGHESLRRISANKVEIRRDSDIWSIESDSPIKVIAREYQED